jgi:dGTPase
MDGRKGSRHYERYDETMFHTLYKDLAQQQEMLFSGACADKSAMRRQKETFHVARPNFVKDVERILHCRYFNRYADKTQVFSLYKNDDISRRILHVQIVSRIARNVGRMLKLNQDLIEAIALGHDLGHAPFGHAGERFLSAIYHRQTGRYFNHNVHSVRILDRILQLNLSLQTLDGILCHNGEKVSGEYQPSTYVGEEVDGKFAAFDAAVEECYARPEAVDHLIPGTLEGCVVRISDVIAYLGKDRQDVEILGLEMEEPFTQNELLGSTNSEFISNIINNLITNSYGKEYLMLDGRYAKELDYEKRVNYKKIYEPQDKNEPYPTIKIMFERIYERLYTDLKTGNEASPVFRHHIDKIFAGMRESAIRREKYMQETPDQIVVDYIASMTDDYFMDINEYLFPGAVSLRYKSYFSEV